MGLRHKWEAEGEARGQQKANELVLKQLRLRFGEVPDAPRACAARRSMSSC
ncbi:MAG: hypothetical protein IT378_14625 [Sandaracinaceae bacterium]|nr:hypothetical protein [Sandaracinaceae bacterium]